MAASMIGFESVGIWVLFSLLYSIVMAPVRRFDGQQCDKSRGQEGERISNHRRQWLRQATYRVERSRSYLAAHRANHVFSGSGG
jgi:hypothetical protein